MSANTGPCNAGSERPCRRYIQRRPKREKPVTEQQRLAAVRRYHILDTPPDEGFDRITALAARLLGAPVALVSVVDEDRIWFKSRHGVVVDQMGRHPGLCASCILQEGPWVITNARKDPRARANPLVAGE